MKTKLILGFFLTSIFFSATKAQEYSIPLFSIEDSILSDTYQFVRKITQSPADSFYRDIEEICIGFNKKQTKLFFDISAKMYKKGYAIKPHYKDLYLSLIHLVQTKSLSSNKLTNFLEIINKSIDSYGKREVANFLKISRLFFEENLIYQSKFNSVEVLGGTFAFDYVKPLKQTEEDTTWSNDKIVSEKEYRTDEKSNLTYEETEALDTISQDKFTLLKTPLPDTKGPYIEFKNIDLIISSVYDTVIISKTNGNLLLTNNYFIGNKGKTDWSEVGLDPSKVYCLFEKYAFNTMKPKLQAGFVKFHYDGRINREIEGIYQYESLRENNSPQAIYPAFQSYYAKYVRNLGEDIRFKGGFTLRGNQISSASLSKGASIIEVSKEGSLKFRSQSISNFSINDSLITNPQTSITIYKTKKDSITHPAISLIYHIKKDLLTLKKEKGYYKNTPFSDPYFGVNIHAEYLIWNITQDSMDLKILNAPDKIPFVAESVDFYSSHIFWKLRGLYDFHPLKFLTHYARKINKKQFSTDNLTNYFIKIYQNKQPHNEDLYDKTYNFLKGMLIYLHSLGFVNYNHENNIVKITHKGWLYTFASKQSKAIDYDNIRITSRTDSVSNATIHFDRGEMTIRGIRDFVINDSLNVYIKPKDGKVIMKENRDINFDGRIVAGKFLIDGKNFNFGYDSFKVDMPKVDSLSFIVTDTSLENSQLLNHSNNIVNTGGTLYISEPNNKSARIKNALYPKLNASQGGKIVFDDNLLDGSYKDKVYIDIDPFTIDSATVDNSTAIKLDGSFISSGIFPDFEDQIHIRADNELGFERNAPPEGYPIYKGAKGEDKEKGHFYEKISMGSNGLRGDGKIEYLSGTFRSNDFVFYTDSVRSKLGNGIITEGNFENISYPYVNAKNHAMRWLPYADTMELRSTNENFKIFNDDYDYRGFFYYTPEGITGKGRLDHELFALQSFSFAFKQNDYTAKRSAFKIYSQGLKPSLLFAEEVEVDHNLNEEIMQITGTSKKKKGFILPFSNYKTDVTNARWDIKSKLITFSTQTKDKSMNFTSMLSQENPIRFKGKAAYYNSQDYFLNVAGVENITVANINIFPSDSVLIIREEGKIDELVNVSLELNKENRNFFLTNGKIKILSGENFTGEASYTYTNDAKESFEIQFYNFETNKIIPVEEGRKRNTDNLEIYQTVAEAQITGDSGYIKIIGGIYFRGDIKLTDTQKNLHFDGQVRLTTERENNHWLDYQTNDADTNIFIHIDEEITDADTEEKLDVGLYFDITERNLYYAFLENDPEWKHNQPIFIPKGNLRFNSSSNSYIINPLIKEREESYRGNTLIYNYEEKTARMEGAIQLIKEDNRLNIRFSGTGNSFFKEQYFYFNTLMTFQPEISTKAYSRIIEDFSQDITEQDKITEGNADTLHIKLAQILSEKAMESYISKSHGEYFSPAPYLDKYIALSEVKFRWSDEFKAFYSIGEIQMSNILNHKIETYVEGYIEIPKVLENNAIHIFLRSRTDEWYFFKMEKGRLKMLSSNGYFNLLSGLKLANFEEAYGMVSAFRRNYLFLEDPIELKPPEELKRKDVEKKKKGEEPAKEIPESDEDYDDEDDF